MNIEEAEKLYGADGVVCAPRIKKGVAVPFRSLINTGLCLNAYFRSTIREQAEVSARKLMEKYRLSDNQVELRYITWLAYEGDF